MKNEINIPDGISFRDEGSRENFFKAMKGDLNQYGFRPMIAITASRPGSGKTALARHILEARGLPSAPTMMPLKEQGWEKLLPAAIPRGYLFLDNVYGTFNSSTLSAFLTSKSWSWRVLGSTRIEEARLDVQVVVTGNNIELGEDLLRRSLVIDLA